jgi:hypothetical protein
MELIVIAAATAQYGEVLIRQNFSVYANVYLLNVCILDILYILI